MTTVTGGKGDVQSPPRTLPAQASLLEQPGGGMHPPLLLRCPAMGEGEGRGRCCLSAQTQSPPKSIFSASLPIPDARPISRSLMEGREVSTLQKHAAALSVWVTFALSENVSFLRVRRLQTSPTAGLKETRGFCCTDNVVRANWFSKITILQLLNRRCGNSGFVFFPRAGYYRARSLLY